MFEMFAEEFPPLLPVGLHRMTLAALRALCVDRFPLSERRPAVMEGFHQAVRMFLEVSIIGELWVDGSFLTEKVEPNDVDFTLRLESAFVDSMTERQLEVVNRVCGSEGPPNCHGFVWATYPESDPRYWNGEWSRGYWIRQWGFSRGQERKGIALVKLPEDAA